MEQSGVVVLDYNWEEIDYLHLVNDVIQYGVKKEDRTGVGTLSLFGKALKYVIRKNVIPLLTTKPVFFRGIVEELLWMIRGETSSHSLSQKGVKIWDAQGAREYLDSVGLKHHPDGELGPVYGKQWRKWKGHDNIEHDQLKTVIETIRNNPNSRRIVLSAWNVSDLSDMALPPCHMMSIFNVDLEKKELNCAMTQRSCDMGLGVPFNIASYSLLTHLLAAVCGLSAGTFTHFMGDVHVYLNHVEFLKLQCSPENFQTRTPFPKIEILPHPYGSMEEIAKLSIDDTMAWLEQLDFQKNFVLHGYTPKKNYLEKVPKMTMAV